MWTDSLGEKQPGIAKVRYTHDALIDLVISRPEVTQGDLAAHFGYSQGWISQIMSSDAFQVALAKRREEVVNPFVRATIEERMKGLAIQAMSVLQERLETQRDAKIALGVLEGTTRALGYGARTPQVQVNNYVAVVPPKARTSEDWERGHTIEVRNGDTGRGSGGTPSNADGPQDYLLVE